MRCVVDPCAASVLCRRGGTIPDVVLVRKSYEEKRRRVRANGGAAAQRHWQLKQLPMEVEAER